MEPLPLNLCFVLLSIWSDSLLSHRFSVAPGINWTRKGFRQLQGEAALHRNNILLEFGENSDSIIAINMAEQLSQVPHGPVRVPAGEPLQHGFQGALTVLHRVGVSNPGGGEGAVRRQMFGVLDSMAFWIQQNHQLFQNIQVVQHFL